MTRKQYFYFIYNKAQDMNDFFKAEGSRDRAVIVKGKLKVLHYVEEKAK